jgi:putative tricarboxylic transport membrane protein
MNSFQEPRIWIRYFPSALFLSCAIVAAIQASSFPDAAGDVPGPALAPLLFAAALAVMGVALAIKVWRETVSDKEAVVKESVAAPSHRLAVLGLVVSLGAYAIVMPLLGFISTTILFLYLCLRLFGHGGGVRAWAFAVVVSYVLFFVFSFMMKVPLPSGWIG